MTEKKQRRYRPETVLRWVLELVERGEVSEDDSVIDIIHALEAEIVKRAMKR